MGMFGTKRHAKRNGSRMTDSFFNAPVLIGENKRNVDLDDPMRFPKAKRKTSKWKQCPHCFELGFLSLFTIHYLRAHLRDSYLAKRLELPHPVPDRAKKIPGWIEPHERDERGAVAKREG